MSSIIVRMFHVASVLESFYSIYVYHKFPGIGTDTYGGDWKYLTFLNLQIKAVYFVMCVVHDVLELFSENSLCCNLKTKLFNMKELFYTTVALPGSLMVLSLFWGIFAYDRELILPVEYAKRFPAYANHCWHTLILIVVVEVATCHHVYPGRKLSFILPNILSVSYIFWVVWIKMVGGVSVYPILAKLDGIYYTLFLASVLAFVQLIFLFGMFLNKATDQLFGYKPLNPDFESKNK